ncbi:MAG TPA: nucleotidyltransferase domain-containing protein [Syntrophaceticus sp.]|jgi:predicted nucleotidyltransferase|nr:nucleotidyltransferase domain-containing protein [Syntrophaceticus schinkii]MDD4261737.1 nucleotidyltransferase domain-containing protein [Syntrophaceticus schinkii]MDD4675872.1 nucleotidyltransferase domain-containing protein [Syntrophaceticus schinkii]HHY30819.1 nucleotidyltransferase domain-containing protein [Syntrophaceticus sp.]
MGKEMMLELVDGLLAIMESLLVRIVLYGSVARGVQTEESDIDIALLIDGTLDDELEDKLSEFIVDMNLKYDKVFSVIDINYEQFKKWEKVLPFYQNVNREGIVLWKAA